MDGVGGQQSSDRLRRLSQWHADRHDVRRVRDLVYRERTDSGHEERVYGEGGRRGRQSFRCERGRGSRVGAAGIAGRLPQRLCLRFRTAGWGSINKDRSSDGKPITLNDVVYPKGLGTHAASTIVYTLGGQYASFHAAVGVDDETFGNGDVSFEVWLDGVKAFDSGVMTAGSDTQNIDLAIAGANELKLVVTNGVAGGDWDHADWGDAQIVYPSGP